MRFVSNVNNEAVEQHEETAVNNNNDDIVDGKIQLDNQSDEENISKDCKISITSPSHFSHNQELDVWHPRLRLLSVLINSTNT